jgi:hypothetical protein
MVWAVLVAGFVWQSSNERAYTREYSDIIYLDCMKKRANTISWPYIVPVVLDGINKIGPPKDSQKAFSQIILDHFPNAQLSVLAPSRVGSSDDDHGGSYFSLNFPSTSKSQGFGKASMGIRYARDQKKVVNKGRHYCRKSVKGMIEYLQYMYFSLKQRVPHPLKWMRVSSTRGGI